MDSSTTSTTTAGTTPNHLSASPASTFTTTTTATSSSVTSTSDTLQLVTLFVFGIVSTAANLLVILTIVMTRKLRTTSSSVLVTNLAVADVALTSVTVPLAACGLMNRRWMFSMVTCSVTSTLTGVFSAASALSVAAIAVDRYLAILHCLRYSVWPRWRYLLLVLVSSWLPALLLGALITTPAVSQSRYLPAQYVCGVVAARSPAYVWCRALVVFLLPLAILLFAYARVIYVARIHSRKIDIVAAPRSRKGSNESGRRSESFSPSGAVAAGALFSIRRLSILSLPQSMEGGGRHFRISGHLELVPASAHVLAARGDGAGHHPQRRSCASFKLVVLVLVFSLCCGFQAVLAVYETLAHPRSDPHPHPEHHPQHLRHPGPAAAVETPADEGGILVTEIADPGGSEYILSVRNGTAGEEEEEEGEEEEEEGVYRDERHQALLRTGLWLMVASSMLNPFLYAISSQRFRYFASRLFSKQDAGLGGGGGGGGDAGDPYGGHLFDVSIYSAFLRNLQTPAASRRSSADSSYELSQQQQFPLTEMIGGGGGGGGGDRRDSGSSVGTATTLLESKGGSPQPSRAGKSGKNGRSRFLEVPNSQEDPALTAMPPVEETVEMLGGGFRPSPSSTASSSAYTDVVFRRQPSVTSATSVTSDGSSCASEGPGAASGAGAGTGATPTGRQAAGRKNSGSLVVEDDFVISTNNAARIRIVLDLV